MYDHDDMSLGRLDESRDGCVIAHSPSRYDSSERESVNESFEACAEDMQRLNMNSMSEPQMEPLIPGVPVDHPDVHSIDPDLAIDGR